MLKEAGAKNQNFLQKTKLDDEVVVLGGLVFRHQAEQPEAGQNHCRSSKNMPYANIGEIQERDPRGVEGLFEGFPTKGQNCVIGKVTS